MKKIFIFILLLFFLSKIQGQTIKELNFKLKAKIDLSKINDDFQAVIQHIKKPIPSSTRAELNQIKKNIPPKRYGIIREKRRSSIPQPILLQSFQGNGFNGIPNDNDMAISNEGKIVSVTNSIIRIFDENGTLLKGISLAKFADTLKIKPHKFDPKVIYDPETDKFVMTFLAGNTDSTSYLIIAFSQTNNPLSKWNLYCLSGNPLNDSSWSDFPMIALTEKNVFYTINLLRNYKPPQSWKTTFKRTIVWKIDKNSGYAGNTLKTKLYSDIKYNNLNIRNVCPIKGGMENMKNYMYFLSNKNFSLKTDSFFLVKINDDIALDSVEITLLKSDNKYGVPPAANQTYGWRFETNDARVLDGYYQNGKIHFVGNTVNHQNSLATIYYGLVENVDVSPNIKLNVLQEDTLELGYPSIVFTGKYSNDNRAIILTNHSSIVDSAGHSVIFMKDEQLSEIKEIKKGECRVTAWFTKNTPVRWGDYTGLQRKYNETGIVWAAGYYGQKLNNGIYRYVNSTWISKISEPQLTNIENQNTNNTKIFPNPTNDNFCVEFESKKIQVLNFMLYDAQGKKNQKMLQEEVKIGKNLLFFNTYSLKKGTYFLIITNENGELLKNEKVVKF